MQYLNESHPEWLRMWKALAEHPLNQGDSECLYGVNRWYYKGSTDSEHHFRHDLHPVTRRAETLTIDNLTCPNFDSVPEG